MTHSPADRRRKGFGASSGTSSRFPSRVLLLVGVWVAAMSVAWARPAPDNAGQFTGNGAPASITELKALERQIQTVVDEVTPTVVGVAGGSGVLVSEDGYVLTVAHVGTRAGRDVTITLPDGRMVKGKTLGNDRGVDAGLVKITEEGTWPHAEMGTSEDLKPGQWCLTLGYPVTFDRDKAPVVRIGRVQQNRSAMLITDATIMGGDSGGPLVDLEGKVIGIGSRCDDSLTTNIYVPIDRFHDSWDRLVQGDDFDSRLANVAFLGVGPDESADEARIGRVIRGSAAEMAGIKVGDVVLKFDGEELRRYTELPPLIRKRKPGDEVEIEVRRDDETLTIKATLGRLDG